MVLDGDFESSHGIPTVGFTENKKLHDRSTRQPQTPCCPPSRSSAMRTCTVPCTQGEDLTAVKFMDESRESNEAVRLDHGFPSFFQSPASRSNGSADGITLSISQPARFQHFVQCSATAPITSPSLITFTTMVRPIDFGGSFKAFHPAPESE